jgi:hypothetical protein
LYYGLLQPTIGAAAFLAPAPHKGGRHGEIHRPQGQAHRAIIKLTGLKRLAGNDTIAGIFRKVGFTQVKVEGDGGTRIAEGLWALEDASADIPPEVTKVTELDEAPIPATRLASAKRKRG